MKHSLFRLSLIAVIGALAFSSCVSQKKVLLLKELQMAEQNKSIEYRNERSLNYKIQPGDNLYIKAINIIDERNSNVLNGESSRYSMGSDASIYLNSYTVNEQGYLDYPLTGLVQVKNLTVEQVKDKLQTELSKFIKETALIVKLSNFDLTIIGEVAKPGKYKVYQTERLLEWNPNLGPAEPYLADAPVLYRSIVVNRLNKIIYWINDDVIEIVDFWDTRREPTAQAEQTQ